jgi:hypothetical protein
VRGAGAVFQALGIAVRAIEPQNTRLRRGAPLRIRRLDS